jgi:hypothetical protein
MQLLSFSLLVGSVVAFAPMTVSRSTSCRLLESPINSDAEKLRESAQKLREEVELMESKLDRKPNMADQVEQVISYSSLKESVWTLAYRFASDPPPNDDEEPRKVSNYSGQLKVKFLSDGYTELIGHEATGGTALDVSKAWGWDKEISEEGDNEYVLFSTNIQLPASDATSPNEMLRFYWQARVVTESSGALSVVDGTVTVKKDVKPPGGFWGVFNGGGILAQFRYVGNFAAKPTSIS